MSANFAKIGDATSHKLAALFLGFSTVFIGGCAEVKIYDITATNECPHEGSVPPLSTFLASGSGHTKLILLHGIADHDPGYAVNPEHASSWLAQSMLERMGLTVVGQNKTTVFPVKEFADDNGLPESAQIALTTQSYRYRAGPNDERTIDAIEIAWSPLTRWLKDEQLCYDINSSETKQPAGCRNYQSFAKRPVQPPGRDLINGLLKNELLDRAFPDAILYTGPYKYDILRGVFWALCQGLSNERQPALGGRLDACTWPSAQSADDRYIFVTHSAGSRIAYDLILGVQGKAPYLTPDIFPADEIGGALPFFGHLHSRTSAVYMMANQLPFLGLANVPIAPEGTVQPYDVEEPGAVVGGGKSTGGQQAGRRWVSVIAAFDHARTQAWRNRSPKGDEPPKLNVVAFSDTNDLLTWALPPWYREDKDAATLAITNVYVHNAWTWAKVYEDPADAHAGYFRNPQVWDVIRCGSAAYATCKSH